MAIQRWIPFGNMREAENEMNRFWRNFGVGPVWREGEEHWNINVDVLQKKDDIVVKASVPGVKPEDIDVAIEDNVLTIKAERHTENEFKDADYLVQERATGSFFRALRLPDTVDTNKIQSSYEHGVLTITMPKAEEKKRKQIHVKVGEKAEAIETKK
jgi:HSP20 family protein